MDLSNAQKAVPAFAQEIDDGLLKRGASGKGNGHRFKVERRPLAVAGEPDARLNAAASKGRTSVH